MQEIIPPDLPTVRKVGMASPQLEDQKVGIPSPQFKSTFLVPDDKILKKLSYSHIEQLISIKDPLKRVFYEIECIKGTWSVKELKRQIRTLLFERSGLSKNPEALLKITNQRLEVDEAKNLIKDVYSFEFLGIPQSLAVEETELESALLDNLQTFILELGNGFCFEARQKRILIGEKYYFIDLVFYHRILRCHVLIELKVEDFEHANAGQLNTYINFYKQNIMQEFDNPTVGILMVTDKNSALVEYATAGMDKNLFVSQYLLQLPNKEALINFVKEELKEL